jgi:hypothetical protein
VRPNAGTEVVEAANAGHVPEGQATGRAAWIAFAFIRSQRLGDTSCMAKILRLPLAEARRAHEMLESSGSMGNPSSCLEQMRSLADGGDPRLAGCWCSGFAPTVPSNLPWPEHLALAAPFDCCTPQGSAA